MVGYQTHFQYFHPAAEPELARVKAVDGLGYKDIRCTLIPDEHMMRLFQKTLPKIGADFQARFARNKKALQYYADHERLADQTLNPRTRTAVFAKAWKAIVGADLPTDLHV